MFAFLMGLAFLYYRDQQIHWKLTLLFFAGMFLFDLTTTAINNYIDTKTNDQELTLPRKPAFAALMILLCVSTACGIFLAYLTDIVVLLTGGLCFLGGILYTWGPVPISRLPLGEALSGIFYGLLIPFLLLYINMPEGTFLKLALSSGELVITLHIMPLIGLLLLSAAPACATANIMLANNICDVERDVLVKRYTLAYYLGKKRALLLFSATYYAVYAVHLVMIIIGILPPLCLLFFITLIPVVKNIRVFRKTQNKETTFLCSIKNYILIMSADAGLIFICGLL
nr:UbiA family prenyltransferase [Anaerovorax odorimutans]